jgi:flagella basal body P-ring formation protein FlgA
VKAKAQGTCVLFVLLSAQAGAAECVAVEGPAVRVSALAPFIDQAPAQQMDRVLASTPDPGTRRWITAAEMHRWGLSPLESLAAPGVCIERRLRPIRSEDVSHELQVALQQGDPRAQLAGITSIQPLLVPEGHLSWPSAGFRLLSSNDGSCSFLWQGELEFDPHRLMAVRVLGRYRAEIVRLVATRNLQTGDVLSASDYERITEPGCPRSAGAKVPPPEGFVMRRALNKGDDIESLMLKAPSVVEGGTTVRVVASSGGASVTIEAIAENPGRRGDSIFVRTRESGKRIRVLLTGKGEASAFVAGAAR